MPRVLTENQMLLTEYLAAIGCEDLAVIVMVLELQDEEATLEMLEFCASNPNTTQAQLLKASSEISSRIKRQRA